MEDLPSKKIDKYHILDTLGKGGFGKVYLAFDPDLERDVALKVANQKRQELMEALATYFDEARMLANLKHPGIVKVHTTGRTETGAVFIVSEYIEGTTLAARLKEGAMDLQPAASLIAKVARALHYAHEQTLVHRDIKPSNIMLDGSGEPILIDFGIALNEENWGRNWEKHVGTPRYMSPEQARGEGHLVDGRSDVFSLGVVMYEALVGHTAFEGTTVTALSQTLDGESVIPPRKINPSIPKELERICLRCMAKLPAERYETAAALAEDLEAFLERMLDAETVDDMAPIVPKGLRSFGPEDASFFLRLLPGAKDRNGLPDSLRFWKTRIEEPHPSKTFRTGLLYGPSGCGKSSLVKAGLLPRLNPSVTSIFLEASQDDTTLRLQAALIREFPEKIDPADSLADALRKLRLDRQQSKILIVIDQFEQWLHARKHLEARRLVNALRQCDGEHIQCLLLVRDDFWLQVSQFMADIQAEIKTGENAVAVDLFTPDHARGVLTEFGRAFGRLSVDGALTPDQSELLEEAIAGLSQPSTGKVVPVRLAVFSEMFKARPWTPASLKQLGGAQGIGIHFLEENLGRGRESSAERPEPQLTAARKILERLLPTDNAAIKGRKVPIADLQEVSGLADSELRELLRWLDIDLHLITPVSQSGLESGDPEGTDSGDEAGEIAYQLTHDFLVPTIRRWLTARKRESRRGRAELCLAERMDLWSHRPEPRNLPSTREVLAIRMLTHKSNWTPAQALMMHQASLKSAKTVGGWSLMVAILFFAGWITWAAVNRSEANRLLSYVEQEATPGPVLMRLPEYQRYWKKVADRLVEGIDGGYAPNSPAHRNASLIVHHLRQDGSSVERLYRHLLTSDPASFPFLLEALGPHYKQIEGKLAHLANDRSSASDPAQLRALLAMASRLPEDARMGNGRTTALWQHFGQIDMPVFGEWIRHCGPLIPSGALRYFAEMSWKPTHGPENRGRAALIFYHLGEKEPLWSILETGSATVERSFLIENLVVFGLPPGELIDRLTAEYQAHCEKPAPLVAPLVNNLALALGNYPFHAFTPAQQGQLRKILQACYLADQPTWHGAASWALRQWGQPLPSIPEDYRRAYDRNWYLSPVSAAPGEQETIPWIEMVRIPAPGKIRRLEGRKVYVESIDYDYFIASMEITELQRQAAQNHARPAQIPAKSAHLPASHLTLEDAMAFCNHLSRVEGLRPFYAVDPDTGAFKRTGEPGEHPGYRLPTRSEWWNAGFSRTNLNLYAGPLIDLRLPYSWVVENSRRRLQPVGLQKPDDSGLFDIIGNVTECVDTLPDKPQGEAFGYGFDTIASFLCNQNARVGYEIDAKNEGIGFRIVRPDVNAQD